MPANAEIDLRAEPQLFGDMPERSANELNLKISNSDVARALGEVAWDHRGHIVGAAIAATVLLGARPDIALGAPPTQTPKEAQPIDLSWFFMTGDGRIILASLYGAVEGGIHGWKTFSLNDKSIKAQTNGTKGMPGKYAFTMPFMGMVREGATDGMTIWAIQNLAGQSTSKELFVTLTGGLAATEGWEILDNTVFKVIGWFHH